MKTLRKLIEAFLNIELPKLTREKTEIEEAAENVKNNLENNDN